MPSLERIRFTSSGTEAAMSALRVARAATARPLILKFAGGYHGHADGLLARAGSGLATEGVPDSAGVDAAVSAGTLVVPYNDLAAVEAAFTAQPRSIAAVIVEPVAANMGVVQRGRGSSRACAPSLLRHGAMLVFDEVITGFRVGPWRRSGALRRHTGPDDPGQGHRRRPAHRRLRRWTRVMCLLAPLGPVYQAGTLAGHPLAMVAGECHARRDDAAPLRTAGAPREPPRARAPSAAAAAAGAARPRSWPGSAPC